MVLADSTRARPRRTEQDRRAEPRRTSRDGEGRARENPPHPQRPAQRHAARQPRAQAEPARPTTDSRDGVEWQVPGLRPPAYRRRGLPAGPESEPGAHEASGANGGKELTPRAASAASLWYGTAAATSHSVRDRPRRALRGAPSFHFHCASGFSEPNDSHTC